MWKTIIIPHLPSSSGPRPGDDTTSRFTSPTQFLKCPLGNYVGNESTSARSVQGGEKLHAFTFHFVFFTTQQLIPRSQKRYQQLTYSISAYSRLPADSISSQFTTTSFSENTLARRAKNTGRRVFAGGGGGTHNTAFRILGIYDLSYNTHVEMKINKKKGAVEVALEALHGGWV